MIVNSIDQTNWTEALEQCESHGMQLAVIDSAEKQETIAQMICSSTVFNERWMDVWIGANDIAEEGQFTWQATGENVTYTNWKPGQPNNYGGKEDCVHIQYTANVDFQWNDDQCSKKKYFICEKYCR
ncbi:AAEL006456-PA [Aedes aegypti]|uniref:AAEL006456-PA n=1 Tax=Aedes aegypti TaxID=7159 RepID=Q175Z8_AEDAE|nr:AAEL006456-PA [Aedes aegypti]